MHEQQEQSSSTKRRFSRREMLKLSGAVAAGGLLAGGFLRGRERYEKGHRADVFIHRAANYEADLEDAVLSAFGELGLSRSLIRGKRILLKPNLVETAPGFQHINTHPAVVAAAAEVFRRLDAKEVVVAEGPGHRRDSWLVLEESGMQRTLEEANLRFVDLNYDEFAPVANTGRWTKLENLYLPKTVLAADWIVSVAKLKTHHWTAMTASMKNLFGLMPGVVYGWPKNVLHHEGIERSILDINHTVTPALAIVDAVVGMEGDGPVMGKPKEVGCLVLGSNLTAIDATCARIMGLRPEGVRYLSAASGWLGPIYEGNITQRGERIDSVKTPFEVLDLPHLAEATAG